MVKFLPIVLVVILMVSGLIYLRFRQVSPAPAQNKSQTNLPATPQNGSQTGNNLTLEERVKTLEDSVVLIAKKIGASGVQQTANQTATTTSPDYRITALEQTVTNLQTQIDALKLTPTPGAPSGKTVVYIPLGSGGSTTDSNWASFDAYQVSLDPADFPGYTSMSLEVTGKLIQAVGTGYARLFNKSDNQAVTSSDVSTTSDKYSVVSSTGFKLSSGRKTYQLQAKTSSNFEFYIQTARIKVSF